MKVLWWLSLLLSASLARCEEMPADLQETLDQASHWYQQGQKATSIEARKTAFNRALVLYSSLEKEHYSGLLLYNIANCYYQLREYPWAVLYYQRALKLSPREAPISRNLALAQEQLALPLPEGPPTWRDFAALHHWLSEQERMELYVLFCVLATVLASGYVWTRWRGFRQAAVWMLACAGFFLASLLSERYLFPIQAVVVQSTPLYTNAGTSYPHVGSSLVGGGRVVEVVEAVDSGHWLKVLTPRGSLGYVPSDAVRVI